MKKEFYAILSVFFFVSIPSLGCGSTSSDSSSQPAGAEIIQKYDLQVESQLTVTTLTLPQQFTDANWGLKEQLCQQAGYDLMPYAGQDVSLVKYSVTEKFYHPSNPEIGALPLYLWVVAKDQTSVCGYFSVREGSNFVPGVFALNDPTIK